MKRHSIAAAAALVLSTAATSSFALELPGPLVQSDWLAKNLQDKSVVVLDVRADTKSFTARAAAAPGIPGMNPCGAKKAKGETAGHIPGARLWDWKTVRTKRTADGIELDGMAPAKEQLEAMMRGLGVNNDSVIIITADAGETSTLTFATRAYWTLKYFGHDKVAVLDGGTVKWKAESRPMSSDAIQAPASGNFSARAERREMLATTADVEAAMKSKSAQLVDGRTANYYLGQEKKDYVYAKGHVPGAKNLAHTQLVDDKTRAFKSVSDLKKLLSEAGIDPTKATITYCDSGHLSSGQWFVLSELAGNRKARLYDGSMHEWTKRNPQLASTNAE
jgi:thiosulfate/3-mercaptopyruvate sulfurtransferase